MSAFLGIRAAEASPAGGAVAGDEGRRVLLVSPYNASLKPWYGVVWEFFDVVAGIERATVVAPPARRAFGGARNPVSEELTRISTKVSTHLRRAVGRPSAAVMEAARVEEDHDICLFVCQFPHEIAEIERVAGWRSRSRLACAFLLEAWSHVLPKVRGDLRLLDRFDHVFTMSGEGVENLRRYTSTPVSFLPTAADCLRVSEGHLPPERCIDVLSIGRINGAAHEVMLRFAEARDLLYVHDVWGGMTAPNGNWEAIRRMNAEMVRRSRFFTVWDPAALLAERFPQMAGQSALSTRYFEGAAGGAALLGGRPSAAEFGPLFDWPDAVIELPREPAAMEAALEAIWADPERWRRAGTTNRIQSLRRHDWSHRWEAILATLGASRTQAHEARVARLLQRAASLEAGGKVVWPVGGRRRGSAALG